MQNQTDRTTRTAYRLTDRAWLLIGCGSAALPLWAAALWIGSGR